MSALQKIEEEVASLPKKDLAEFRSWFEEFDAREWDSQLEDDLKAGKLDKLAQKAIKDFNNGDFKNI